MLDARAMKVVSRHGVGPRGRGNLASLGAYVNGANDNADSRTADAADSGQRTPVDERRHNAVFLGVRPYNLCGLGAATGQLAERPSFPPCGNASFACFRAMFGDRSSATRSG